MFWYQKICDSLLPPDHPNRALPRINLGNVYFATNPYQMALEENQNALKLEEISLPQDYPGRVQTLHNIDLVRQHQQQHMKVKKDSVMTSPGKMENVMVE